MTAVIPPADAPLMFEKIAGQIFQNCADGQGQRKYKKRSFFQTGKQHTEQNPAGSVNWKVRSLIYAAVDEGVLRKKEQQHFPEPACKGSNEKEKNIKIKAVGWVCFHVLRMSDFWEIIQKLFCREYFY